MKNLKVLFCWVVLVCAVVAFATPAICQTKVTKPESVGLSSERIQRIGNVMKQEVAKGAFPGAVVLIARDGKVVYFDSYGYLDGKKEKPMPKDAIFSIASMSKPIVTAAAMMMVEQGKFNLNDPIFMYLPEFKDMKVEVQKKDAEGNITYETVPAARPIMIQDLMRHTSGFTYGAFGARSENIAKAYEQADVQGDITAAEMIKRLSQIPLAFQPGTTFEYGMSVDVLGILMERVAGKGLDEILQEMILTPLKMKDTAFYVPPEKATRLAGIYDSDPHKAPLLARIRVWDNPAGKRYFAAGSGLASTTEDYFHFAQMMLNGGTLNGSRLLSKKTVEFMLSDHLMGAGANSMVLKVAAGGPGYGFGLGFAVRLHEGFAWTPGTKGDAGWTGIFGTIFTIDPKEKLVGILMNLGPSQRIHTWCLFKDMLYGAVIQ
ncbi:MAG TPA: serine hydrolase domain-containing protein [Desulfomonilaceae bacterium]|nr:serine hydrolase domain-containing protein [Desulfomonilaceae bacterium]